MWLLNYIGLGLICLGLKNVFISKILSSFRELINYKAYYVKINNGEFKINLEILLIGCVYVTDSSQYEQISI